MIRRPHRQGRRRAGAAVSLSLALHLLALALLAYHGRAPAPGPAPPLAAEKFVKRLPPAQRPLSRGLCLRETSNASPIRACW